MKWSVSDDALTPCGGLVLWAAYTKHLEFFEKTKADCPVVQTSPNTSPVYDVMQLFMLTALTDDDVFPIYREITRGSDDS